MSRGSVEESNTEMSCRNKTFSFNRRILQDELISNNPNGHANLSDQTPHLVHAKKLSRRTLFKPYLPSPILDLGLSSVYA